jgi:hypothetical protein
MIGHCGVDHLKKNANIHGLKLKGDFKICEDCELDKSSHRNVNKTGKAEVKYREKEFI